MFKTMNANVHTHTHDVCHTYTNTDPKFDGVVHTHILRQAFAVCVCLHKQKNGKPDNTMINPDKLNEQKRKKR